MLIYAFSSPVNYNHNPKVLSCLSYVYWAKLEPINNRKKNKKKRLKPPSR